MQTPTRTALVCAALALSVMVPASAHAKAWTPSEGDGYAKVWLRGLFGNSAFFADGSVKPVESFQDVSLRHYIEYGLTNDWTLLSHGAPAGFASYDANSTAYVGPIAVGVRRGFRAGPVQLGAEFQYGFAPPLGNTDLAAAGSPVSYRPAVQNHFGVGELQAGYDLGWGWMVGSAGFQFNSADTVDPAITGFAQLGVKLTDAWLVDAHAGVYQPVEEVTVTNVSGVGQTRYIGFGLGVSWWMSESIGLSAGVDGAAATQSNASTPSFTTGVQAKF